MSITNHNQIQEQLDSLRRQIESARTQHPGDLAEQGISLQALIQEYEALDAQLEAEEQEDTETLETKIEAKEKELRLIKAQLRKIPFSNVFCPEKQQKIQNLSNSLESCKGQILSLKNELANRETNKSIQDLKEQGYSDKTINRLLFPWKNNKICNQSESYAHYSTSKTFEQAEREYNKLRGIRS